MVDALLMVGDAGSPQRALTPSPPTHKRTGQRPRELFVRNCVATDGAAGAPKPRDAAIARANRLPNLASTTPAAARLARGTVGDVRRPVGKPVAAARESSSFDGDVRGFRAPRSTAVPRIPAPKIFTEKSARQPPIPKLPRRNSVGAPAPAKTSLYDVLGVDVSSDAAEIKRAYRALALQLHPDKNPSTEAHQRFVAVKEAYATLAAEGSRGDYDKALATR